jgi:hypothetical protein
LTTSLDIVSHERREWQKRSPAHVITLEICFPIFNRI